MYQDASKLKGTNYAKCTFGLFLTVTWVFIVCVPAKTWKQHIPSLVSYFSQVAYSIVAFVCFYSVLQIFFVFFVTLMQCSLKKKSWTNLLWLRAQLSPGVINFSFFLSEADNFFDMLPKTHYCTCCRKTKSSMSECRIWKINRKKTHPGDL